MPDEKLFPLELREANVNYIKSKVCISPVTCKLVTLV